MLTISIFKGFNDTFYSKTLIRQGRLIMKRINNGLLPVFAGVCLFVVSTILSEPILAQNNDDELNSVEDAAELDRVAVTGTRIRRAQLEGAKPVLTLDREDLERTGLTSIGDVLQELTISGSAINTAFNSSGNFGFPPDGGGVGAGATRFNLRGLGSNRTLVLVNGQRWVPGSSASGVPSSVDLNTIPITAIERVEVLKDGASTVYGADAIAGVVNIITRIDFDGLEANAYAGNFIGEGDGAQQQYDLSLGQTGSRSSVFVNFSYSDQKTISSNDREQSRFPVPGTGVTRGSSGTPQGRFIFSIPGNTDSFGGLCTPTDTDGDGVNDSTSCDVTTNQGASFAGGIPNFPGDFIPFSDNERFNFSPFNLLQTPNERAAIWAEGRYDLVQGSNFNATIYSRFLFNRRESVNRAAPEPIFLGPGAGTGNSADFTSIDATNPFNPFGVGLDAATNFVLLGRRPTEAGPRIFEQQVDTLYFNGGLEGSFQAAGRYFDWDINVVFSENSANQITQGSFRLDRLAQALGPVDQCVGDANGCVPLNLFGGQQGDDIMRLNGGGGTITAEQLAFITFPLQDTSEQDLFDFNANISGSLFDLPAGPVGFAIGYEHRDQEGFFQPDAIVVAGNSNGVPALPTSGGFDVDSIYGELVIPVLSGVPGAELLEISGSIRNADFSTFGSTTNGKVELRWKPIADLLIRGTFAEGFRSPSIGELFGSESRFDAVLADPCNTASFPTLPADQQANCIALGAPDGGVVQVNPQISVITGGNDQLGPESADSYSAGFVYSPSWASDLPGVDSFDYEINWYRHELGSAIRAVDAQFILDECVRTFDPSLCGNISRNANGNIAGFNNRLTNIGGIETSGIDFSFNYLSPATSVGRFGVDWNTTHIIEFEEIVPAAGGGFQTIAREGVEFNNSAIPEWQSNANFFWSYDHWSAVWTVQYTSSVTESCSDFLDGTPNSFVNLGLCSNPEPTQLDGFGVVPTNDLGSNLYNDIHVTYRTKLFGAETSLTVGAENIFDNDPPICLSCSLNGFDPSTYRIPGRFLFGRLSVRL